MVKGNQPTDGGWLLFTKDELEEHLATEPQAEQFFKRFLSAYEFLNGQERFCLWLKDVPPTEWRTLPEIVRCVSGVRAFRKESTKAVTRQLANVPYLFAEIRQPNSNYVLFPRHSSEHRRFIPIAFFSPDNIVADSCNAVPDASIYHFGVLTSTMHNAWMRQVCGRIKSDYRYSNKLVYNNFPWPGDPTDKQRNRVEQTAQGILDARARFPNATLADLYDPLAMPKELLDAHRANDEAVDACYGKRAFKSELERLEFLFELYRQYTEPLGLNDVKPKKRRQSR